MRISAINYSCAYEKKSETSAQCYNDRGKVQERHFHLKKLPSPQIVEFLR